MHVTCGCCMGVYRYLEDAVFRGRPQRSGQCQRTGKQGKSDGAMLVTVGTIAAIRLRGEAVRPGPRLRSAVADAVSLARLVLAELQRVD